MTATALKPRHEEMLRLRESGLSAAQIACELGVAENSVFVALKRLRNQGVEVPVSTAPVGLRGPSIAIPAWVPKSLHADYRKVAAERGEEEAASWVRRTKNGEPVALSDLAAATTRAKPQVRKPYGSATTSTQQASAKAGFTWTQDCEANLRRLHGEGWSAGAIAAEIGAPTRNVVIGKLARLGLKRDVVPVKAAVPSKPVVVRAPGPKIAQAPAPKPAPPKLVEALPATTEAEAAPDGAITIHELRDHRCHWPFGDPRDESFRYCGAAVAPETRERGRFYCDGHMAAASQPAKGRGR